MKTPIFYPIIFLLTLFSLQCSGDTPITAVESSANVNTSPQDLTEQFALPEEVLNTATTLQIIGYDIWLRYAPKTGEVVAKLEHGTTCTILAKGERDELLGLIDYWYQVRTDDGQEGYVFGCQTTAREQVPSPSVVAAYPLPAPLPCGDHYSDELVPNKYISVPNVYFLGWSNAGDYAVAISHNLPTDYDQPLVYVYDKDNNEKWKARFSPIEYVSGDRTGIDRQIWTDNIFAIRERLAVRHAINPMADLPEWRTLPERISTSSGQTRYYAIHLDHTKIPSTEFAGDAITQTKGFLEVDGHGSIQILDWNFEMIANVQALEQIGYLRRAGSDQILVLFASQRRGFEGQMINIRFLSWDLTDLG